jgi:hypothetical protein
LNRYEKVLIYTAKEPQGKAKEMLKDLKNVEVFITLNFYKDAKVKAKKLGNCELKDLGDFGERAMMRDPC